MNNNNGYLVYTTHDQDEVDATFVPETETAIIKELREHARGKVSDDRIQELFNAWAEDQPGDLRWHSQSNCEEQWPFNDLHILGTFYFLVY